MEGNVMDAKEAINLIEKWLAEEGLQSKSLADARAQKHLHVRYPPSRNGHLFNIVVPKGRNLVIIGSVTRVDAAQQDEMTSHAKADPVSWEGWLHDTRLSLIRGQFDWTIHVGKNETPSSGPLQAFNISRPIWFDGLNQHRFLDTLRRIWLSKLGIIHEIRFAYGQGSGTPGPVDDWAKSNQAPNGQSAAEVEFQEGLTFGSSFDVDEWA
jgi:hypothetical protein